MVGGAFVCGILMAQPAIILDACISRTLFEECPLLESFVFPSFAYFHSVLRIAVGDCP